MLNRIKKSAQLLKQPRTIAVAGILIALSVVLEMCRIQITQELRVSFGFTAMAIIAMLFGPAVAVPAAIVGDLLGLLLNPSGGYFFGFTITAMLSSLVYSLFLYDRSAPRHDGHALGHGSDPLGKENIHLFLRALGAKAVVNFVCNVGLNTLWLGMFYGESMRVLFPMRAVKNAILLIPEAIVLFFALKAAMHAWKQIRR